VAPNVPLTVDNDTYILAAVLFKIVRNECGALFLTGITSGIISHGYDVLPDALLSF
jgi:hypothetical protein